MKFSVILKGDKVKNKQVPIDILGRFLVSFQSLVTEIARATEKIPKDPESRKIFNRGIQVYATDIREGSTDVVLYAQTPPPQATLDIGIEPEKKMATLSPVERALRASVDGIGIIQSKDDVAAYTNFEKSYPNRTRRVRIFNHYRGMYSTKGATVAIQIPPEIAQFKDEVEIEIQQSYADRVVKWLNMELRISEQVVRGIITRVKGDGPTKYFTLLDENNTPLECIYTDDTERQILGLFKTPVEVKGEYFHVKSRRKLKHVLAINAMDSIAITPGDYLPLLQPIDFTLEYCTDDGFYIAENDDLGMRIVGSSLNELRENIVQDIDFKVDMFLIQKRKNMTPGLKKIIILLSGMVDVTKRKDPNHWSEISPKELEES